MKRNPKRQPDSKPTTKPAVLADKDLKAVTGGFGNSVGCVGG